MSTRIGLLHTSHIQYSYDVQFVRTTKLKCHLSSLHAFYKAWRIECYMIAKINAHHSSHRSFLLGWSLGGQKAVWVGFTFEANQFRICAADMHAVEPLVMSLRFGSDSIRERRRGDRLLSHLHRDARANRSDLSVALCERCGTLKGLHFSWISKLE